MLGSLEESLGRCKAALAQIAGANLTDHWFPKKINIYFYSCRSTRESLLPLFTVKSQQVLVKSHSEKRLLFKKNATKQRSRLLCSLHIRSYCRSVSPARSSRSSQPSHVRTTSLSKNLIMKPQNTNMQKVSL